MAMSASERVMKSRKFTEVKAAAAAKHFSRIDAAVFRNAEGVLVVMEWTGQEWEPVALEPADEPAELVEVE